MKALALIFTVAALCPAISLKKDTERKRAPEFELKDRDGRVVRLSDYTGKVVLVDFWATWCLPCQDSMPWLNQLADKYGNEGLTVFGISMNEDGWTTVKPFIEKMHVTYPILMGTKRAAYLYGDVQDLPVAFFIDRERRVAAIHAGAPSR